eukprot:403366424
MPQIEIEKQVELTNQVSDQRRQAISQSIEDYQSRVLNEVSSQKIYSDCITIIQLQKNGNILASDSTHLYLLTKKLKVVRTHKLDYPVYNAVQSGRKLFAQVGFQIKQFDTKRQYQIKTVNPRDEVQKMKKVGKEYIMLGETNGHVQLISTALNTITKSSTLDYTACAHRRRTSFLPSIYDIIRIKSPVVKRDGASSNHYTISLQRQDSITTHIHHLNEYAFATRRGVVFCKLDTEAQVESDFLRQDFDEEYLRRLEVKSIVQIEPDVLIASLENTSSIFKIYRGSKTMEDYHLRSGLPYNSQYIGMKKIKGYDSENFPYVLLRDLYSIQILDTKKMEIVKTLKSELQSPEKLLVRSTLSLRNQFIILRKRNKFTVITINLQSEEDKQSSSRKKTIQEIELMQK